jgi:hypothetical protein
MGPMLAAGCRTSWRNEMIANLIQGLRSFDKSIVYRFVP